MLSYQGQCPQELLLVLPYKGKDLMSTGERSTAI